MTGWRKVAEELRQGGEAQHVRHNRHDSPPSTTPTDPLKVLREWQAGLDCLDVGQPLHGLDAARWRQLVGDAAWVLDRFGKAAACDGWSALDLFGVLPGKDGWGGVADRLRGARSLEMTADLGRWCRLYAPSSERFCRGGGEDLPLVVLWEA